MEDLNKIIEKCSSGDARAQAKLYEFYAPIMFGVCLRYASNITEAEDNLQDGFIKVFKYIGEFRHEGSFEGWIRRIMVHESIGKYRKKMIMYPVEDVEIYEKPNYSDDILGNISAQELIKLIQELTPRYRMVFNLYVLEGMNHNEISKEMNISVGTSKSNLARAREVLQGKVKELYNEININANSTA